jgi:4-amino-4-deoxy-L-arabinose transferase-like glycosyltransferase
MLLVTAPLAQLGDRTASFERRRPFVTAGALILIIVVAVLSGAYRKPFALPGHCPLPFRVADNLLQQGVFSAAVPDARARPEAERPMPPAYPALMTMLAKADARLAQGVDCRRLEETRAHADDRFAALRIVQAAAGIGILVVVFYLAVELLGSRAVACAAVVLYVIGGKLGEFSRVVEPHNFYALFLLLGFYLLAVAYRTRRIALFGAAGASLGLAALFSGSAVPLLFVPLALAAASKSEDRGRGSAAMGGVALLLAGLIVVGPWALRNAVLFGDPMLADQADALLLSFRVAYNAMPYSDWPLAELSWVPSYGDVITRLLFGETAVHRFGLLAPGAYFNNGHAIYAAALSATPPGANPYFVVWSRYVAADPARHVLTSIPVFTHGMWGTHGFMGILGLCLLPRLMTRLRSGPNRSAAVAVAACAVSLVAVQALITPNFYWMNAPMLLLMALAIADFLPGVAAWLDRKLSGWSTGLALEPDAS